MAVDRKRANGVCTVVFADDRTQVLLQKREDFRMWGLPGGLIEADETAREAAVRETLAVKWFSTNELPERLAPQTGRYIQDAYANHPHKIQTTMTYSRRMLLLRRVALALRSFRNRSMH